MWKLTANLTILSALTLGALMPMACAQDHAIDLLEEGDDKVETGMAQLTPRQLQALNKGAALLQQSIMVRVRATKSRNGAERFIISWREGGEGLGGKVRNAQFLAPKPEGADSKAKNNILELGQWSEPVSLTTIVGRVGGWRYPTVEVAEVFADRATAKKFPVGGVTTELEFSSPQGVFKTFEEASPNGLRRSFVVPTHLLAQGLYRQGYHENPTDTPAFRPEAQSAFIAQLQPLSGYVNARYARLQKKYSHDDPLPRQFGVVGNVTGYGKFGHGVRYGDPEIVRTELKVLNLLGFNGHTIRNGVYKTTADVVIEEKLAEQEKLDRIYWGGPGSDTPMDFFNGKADLKPSPFHPALKEYVDQALDRFIAIDKPMPAQEKWALWGDEIYVAMDRGFENCEHCIEPFREFLKLNNVQPKDVGAASWDEVKPVAIRATNAKGQSIVAPRSDSATERLLFYYTYRFASYSTGLMYAPAAKKLEDNGMRLYAMLAPSPTWSGSIFDWHDFYAAKPNRALVFETSNRDPRVWQWESYLSDIMRGVAEGTSWVQGGLIKPHRGGSKQRMLSMITRGTRAIEWYTYGPDYAKADSYSHNPELLDTVAEANRFLGKAEEYLYEAKLAQQPEVAFVYPRESYVWEDDLGNKFKDARWVYLALKQAHIPVDVLSSQHLAERDLSRYKAIYIVGANLRSDVATKVKTWVSNGGLLWTDANGLSRDEADNSLTALQDVLGLGERSATIWGVAPMYKATSLKPLAEKEVPEYAAISVTAAGKSTLPAFAATASQATAGETAAQVRAFIGREAIQVLDANVEVLATFADGKPAMTRKRFGKGEAVVAGLYAGLAYSAKVRRPDFDMFTDYSAALRDLIAGPALQRGVYRPVVPESPQVESVFLEKDGKRSVALMNWMHSGNVFQPITNLEIALPGVGKVTKVRSLQQGDLPLQGSGENLSVVLPKMGEIDLLILE